MDIELTELEGLTVISLSGRLDTTTAPDLDAAATKLFESGVYDIRVDMADCEFVSSAGLRVIVAMQKHVMGKGSLVFANVKPEVMDVFDMTGFTKILTIE